jgi:hypothetical protein
VTTLKNAACATATANGDDPFRFRNLLVDSTHPIARLAGDRSGANHDIRVAWRGFLEYPKSLHIIARSKQVQDLDITSIAPAAVVV